MQIKPMLLDIAQIEASLSRGKISYFETIDSTNNYLLANGECRDICISEMQNAGRGRRGNHWVSPPSGNIYFSQCWCFDSISEYWSLLGLITGIAIAAALEDIGLTGHGVKWPNDIFWQDQKLGGILLETLNQSGKIVIGIGLNVNMPSTVNSQIDQPFISLSKAMQGKPFSREELVIALINRLQQQLIHFTHFDYECFIESWKKWDILLGKAVSFYHQGALIAGTVVEINKQGLLGILTADGKVSFFSSADIRLNKSFGNKERT